MATPHQKHTALEFELFHTFLEADWYEFRTVGTTSVTNQIPRSRRSQFVDSFQALTRAGCREDVLFPCVLVFLNSQISGVDFPWAKKFEPIRTGLKKIRDATQEVMQFPGFRKLESNSNEPSLAVFSRFISAHRALLKTAGTNRTRTFDIKRGSPWRALEHISNSGTRR